MTLTKAQIKMMQEDMYAELVQILMEVYGYSQDKALETLYNSDTFARLQDIDTGLYYQSTGYVYSFLKSSFANLRNAGTLTPIILSGSTVGINFALKSLYCVS